VYHWIQLLAPFHLPPAGSSQHVPAGSLGPAPRSSPRLLEAPVTTHIRKLTPAPTHEDLQLPNTITAEGGIKLSTKEDFIRFINLMKLLHGEQEVKGSIRMAIRLRQKLKEKEKFKTRNDWLQKIKTTLLQTKEQRREERKKEKEQEGERQKDLKRLEVLAMFEEKKNEEEGTSEDKEEVTVPAVDTAEREARLSLLAARKLQLEEQKLSLFLLLQDKDKLSRLQG